MANLEEWNNDHNVNIYKCEGWGQLNDQTKWRIQWMEELERDPIRLKKKKHFEKEKKH